MGVHVDGRSRTGSPRIQDGGGEAAEAEEDRTRGQEAVGNRHVVVEVVEVVAAEGKHREETVAAAEEEGDHRDVVVEEVGIHHDAAAAAHTCRKGEGEGSEASSREEEAGKDEYHCRYGSHGRAFQSGDEGRRGARHPDDEDEDLVREAREAHEAHVPLRLHRLTTPHP